MNVLLRLGQLFGHKYGEPNFKDVEASIRNQLDALWHIPNQTYNILRACSDANATNPSDERETLALSGFHFCRRIVGIIDYLKANRNDVPLSVVRRGLEEILGLIKESIGSGKENEQFPNVSELIFQMLPSSKKHDRKLRDQQYQKARKGLSRIASISMTILNQMNKLGGATELSEGRFDPRGAKLSQSEIMSFIRQNGDKFGIPDLTSWSLLLDIDPSLELPLTKLIHALSRGQIPKEGEHLKKVIRETLIQGRQNKPPTNIFALNKETSQESPLILFPKNNKRAQITNYLITKYEAK